MSDPFDPVEDWLGSDIELLPPQPGAFERIHHRARRRKTVVAMASAAGAVVAIAAAAALPQLVSSLQPSNTGPNKVVPFTSRSNSPRPGHHRSTPPAPGHGPTTRSCGSQPTGSNQSIPHSSQRPALGIEPSSVTFVSDAVGAVIGEATSGPARGCEAVAATSNYGRTWTKVDPPPVGPPNGSSGVSQIRFLESRNGWAYGPGLYVTHNGGATWAKATGVHGRVIDLATVGGSAYAVVASCTGAGSDYAGGCTSFALYSSPYNSDTFQAIAGASGKGQVKPGDLQLTHTAGYLLVGNVLFTGPTDGSSPWQAVTISSGKVPACLAAPGHRFASGESGLLAPGVANVAYLLCQPAGGGGGSLYTSTDAGATWQLDGQVKAQGNGKSLAVGTRSNTLVLATSAGIYYSTDKRHWHRAGLSGLAPFGGFGYIGMTTQYRGVAVPAVPGPVIFVTNDGGRHWHPKRIA